MSESLRNLPHLSLPHHPSIKSRQDYTYPRKVVDKRPNPARNRWSHASKLRSDLGNVFGVLQQEREASGSEADAVGKPGFYLDVEFSVSEKDKVLQSLESSKAKIELMSVSVSPRSDNYMEATLFVPDSKKDYFENKITAYENEETKYGKPKNEALVQLG